MSEVEHDLELGKMVMEIRRLEELALRTGSDCETCALCKRVFSVSAMQWEGDEVLWYCNECYDSIPCVTDATPPTESNENDLIEEVNATAAYIEKLKEEISQLKYRLDTITAIINSSADLYVEVAGEKYGSKYIRRSRLLYALRWSENDVL